MEALRHEDGTLHQFMPRIDGKSFRCPCGCNVFHKPDKTNLDLFECNSCGDRYHTTPVESVPKKGLDEI